MVNVRIFQYISEPYCSEDTVFTTGHYNFIGGLLAGDDVSFSAGISKCIACGAGLPLIREERDVRALKKFAREIFGKGPLPPIYISMIRSDIRG